MPINRDVFEKGELGESLASKVEKFLKENNQSAYTREEIFDSLFSGKEFNPGTVADMSIALAELSKTNVVDARKLKHNDGKERVYYIARAA